MWQENCNPLLFPEHAWRWSIHTPCPSNRLTDWWSVTTSWDFWDPGHFSRNSPALKSVLVACCCLIAGVGCCFARTPQDKIGTRACLLCWRLWPKFFFNLCEKISCYCCCCCCDRDDRFQGICKWAFRCPCAKEKPTTRHDETKPWPTTTTTTTTTLFALHLQRGALRILAANHWQEFWFSYANLLRIVSDCNNSYYYTTLISHSTTFLQLQ